MKYYAICALLLVPLVYGAAVPRTENADVDLVPDMSVASDAYSNAQPSKRHVPPFRFMNEQMENNADIDLIPDMSVAADADDNEGESVDLWSLSELLNMDHISSRGYVCWRRSDSRYVRCLRWRGSGWVVA